MKPSFPNAFRRNSIKASGAAVNRIASLASMQVVLKETVFGWTLKLSPMRAFDALRVWPKIADPNESHSLVYDVELAPVERIQSRRRASSNAGRSSIADLAATMGIVPEQAFGENYLVLDDLSLRELIGMTNTTRMKSVLIEGPVEEGDAEAIGVAERNRRSPLEAELRAQAAITVERDREIVLHTRQRDQAIHLVTENFRHYLAALHDESADVFGIPEVWQVQRLLELTGCMTVRPIESQVYSTSVDVGISTSPTGEERPADQSLIYDIPSRTWHDEP